jgi:phosphoglycerol transferase MdoB-like AlkP superfamily enzyme
MGILNLARRRVRKNRLMMISITTFLVIMVVLTFFGKANTVSEFINPRWIITGIIFSICIAIAYFMNFDRMYIYAFLLAGAFNLSEEIRENDWIISEGGYAYLIASIVLFIIGLIYLTKFLKKYPLPGKRVDYDK